MEESISVFESLCRNGCIYVSDTVSVTVHDKTKVCFSRERYQYAYAYLADKLYKDILRSTYSSMTPPKGMTMLSIYAVLLGSIDYTINKNTFLWESATNATIRSAWTILHRIITSRMMVDADPKILICLNNRNGRDYMLNTLSPDELSIWKASEMGVRERILTELHPGMLMDLISIVPRRRYKSTTTSLLKCMTKTAPDSERVPDELRDIYVKTRVALHDRHDIGPIHREVFDDNVDINRYDDAVYQSAQSDKTDPTLVHVVSSMGKNNNNYISNLYSPMYICVDDNSPGDVNDPINIRRKAEDDDDVMSIDSNISRVSDIEADLTWQGLPVSDVPPSSLTHKTITRQYAGSSLHAGLTDVMLVLADASVKRRYQQW